MYQIAPGANFLVTLDGNQLMTKLGSQPRVPVFPESETMFFAKVVDAQIEFAKLDASDVPGRLILHQNGRDQPADRLSEVGYRPGGADNQIKFEKGGWEYRISMSPDGKVAAAGIRPTQ